MLLSINNQINNSQLVLNQSTDNSHGLAGLDQRFKSVQSMLSEMVCGLSNNFLKSGLEGMCDRKIICQRMVDRHLMLLQLLKRNLKKRMLF